MGRSRNPLNPDGSVGKKHRVLPPCRVCGAPAAGFHYGANTCEACKAFFHRSITRHHLYKCDALGVCEIDHTLDQLCQRCRYKKSQNVGMSVNAIRTGRYTTFKKYNDQIELLQLKNQKDNIDEPVSCPVIDLTSPTTNIVNDKAKRKKLRSCTSKPDAKDSDYDSAYDSQIVSPATPCARYDCYILDSPPAIRKKDYLGTLEDKSIRGDKFHRPGHTFVPPSPPRHIFPYNDSGKLGALSKYYEQVPFTVQVPNHHWQDFNGEPVVSLEGEKRWQGKTRSSYCHGDIQTRQESHYNFNTGEDLPSRTPWRVSQLNQQDRTGDINRYYTEDQGLALIPPEKYKSFPSPTVGEPTCSVSPPSLTNHSEINSEFFTGSVLSYPSLYDSPPPLAPSLPEGCSSARSPSTNAESTELISLTDKISLSNEALLNEKHAVDTECWCLLREGYDCDVDDNSSKKFCYVCLDELYRDKDSVIAALDKAREEFLDPIFINYPKENQEEIFTNHYETCKEKVRIFGDLSRISDEERDSIRGSTGIDANNRHKDFNLTLKSIETHIRCVVKFAKHIPGFKYITTLDKINLIKQSRSELMFAGVYKCVDSVRRIGKCCDNILYCSVCLPFEYNKEAAVRQAIAEEVETHFIVAQKLQKLNLSLAEDAVYQAIILMRPDRPIEPQDPAVKTVHSYLLDCLWTMMQRSSPESSSAAKERYARAMALLEEVRGHSDQTLAIFRLLSIRRYSDLSDNPFLLEVLREYF